MIRDQRVVALGLLVERASADAVKALKHAGVRAILLKGPLQQTWLEAAGPPRASVDVDVLVSRDQLLSAETALGDIGYRRAVGLPGEAGREHASDWVAPGKVPVEVHWSLVGVDERKIWGVISSETEEAVVMGETIEVPNEAARCLIVALHAAQHGIGQTGIFGDLEKALAVARLESWVRAVELARDVGGWTAFGGALSVTPRGRALLSELGVSAPVLDERQALSLLTPAPTSRGFYFLARQPGAAGKVAFVLMKLVPQPAFMRMRYPLARRGTAGLVAAYLYRPFWLVRWALPGFLAWRGARDLARASGSAESHTRETTGSGDPLP